MVSLRSVSLSCAAFFLLMVSHVGAKSINDSIIAIVNKEVITLKDLKDYMASVYRQLKIEHRSSAEIREVMASYEQKGVNQLIEDKLILDAADAKGIEIRPEIIKKRLKEIKDRYPSEDDFQREINAQGITGSDLKKKITNQLKSKYIVDMEVSDKVTINPEEVTRYYNNHKDEFETKTKYDLDSIYISFKNGKEEALKKIQEAKSKIFGGADFKEVAKIYSEAASVGSLEEGQMVAEVEKEVFALKKGDVSRPLEVASGVYLFKINEINPGRKQLLEEVKNNIYDLLYQQQFQDKFRVWMEKLRKKAYVEVRN